MNLPSGYVPPLMQRPNNLATLLDSSSEEITSANTSVASESSPQSEATTSQVQTVKLERTESNPTPLLPSSTANDKKRKAPTAKPGGVYINYGQMVRSVIGRKKECCV